MTGGPHIVQCIAKNCYVTLGSNFSCCPDCSSIPVAKTGEKATAVDLTRPGYDIHNLPWKIHPFLIGEPSISIRAIYTMANC